MSIMPQTWTLWPLPVPNLIPSYDPEQSGPGLSLRMTGKTQPMEKSVCIATWRRCKNKFAQTPLRSAIMSEGNLTMHTPVATRMEKGRKKMQIKPRTDH